MSTHSVSDFAASLVEMAEATRRLPLVEADLAAARYDIQEHLNTIQRLELRLLDKNSIIEAHLATIRQLEVARDDAELRFLECDDAKSTLERVLRNVISEAQGVLQAIAPVPEPKGTTDAMIDDKIVDVITDTPLLDSPLVPRDTYQGVKSDEAPGQSATDPTADMAIQSPPVNTETVAELENASGTASEGHRADPFPAISTTDTIPSGASPTATPSADATSLSDPEPAKYIDTGERWYTPSLNPEWVNWFNRQPPTGQ